MNNEPVKISKLVHGGQGLGQLEDGKKIFVWGALPGEEVSVKIVKKKSSYIEAVSEDIIISSPERLKPKEPNVYLSSSPWQIMTYEAENKYKQQILAEAFDREGVKDVAWDSFEYSEEEYGYRNKIELGFWGDENGLHHASYIRGSHGKQIIESNALASSYINDVLEDFLHSLSLFVKSNNLRAGDFKTVIFRCSKAGEVVAGLFTKKDIDFSGFKLPTSIKGLAVYYSNPKSPASIPTKKLHEIGDCELNDTILGREVKYDVLSFFQVNLTVFEKAAKRIKSEIGLSRAIDFYSGVGTIGVAVGAKTLVESDPINIAMAKKNAQNLDTQVVHSTSEQAVEYIDEGSVLIIDPPRAGLHKTVVEKILEVLPPKVIYLSCNPSTQARDVKILSEKYKISSAVGYNFFPRTPHIESLVVLER
jgi:23S rRNA (uracil1939-C5)-methyltransferase